MWYVVLISALEAQSKLGGEDLIPFYGLLDGGREGELFAELEDYFYYAQIRRLLLTYLGMIYQMIISCTFTTHFKLCLTCNETRYFHHFPKKAPTDNQKPKQNQKSHKIVKSNYPSLNKEIMFQKCYFKNLYNKLLVLHSFLGKFSTNLHLVQNYATF